MKFAATLYHFKSLSDKSSPFFWSPVVQGDWLFAKRRLPKGPKGGFWPPHEDSILGCVHPLLAVPPPELAEVLQYDHNDGGTKPLRPVQAARVGFLIFFPILSTLVTFTLWIETVEQVNFVMNAAIDGVNAALARFKSDVCSKHGQKPNLERTFRLVPEHIEKKRLQEAKQEAKRKATAAGHLGAPGGRQ